VSGAGGRWVVVVVPACLYFFSYFHRVAPAVVAGDVMRAFGLTAAALGTLAAVYPYVFVATALVGGTLADTLGPRWTLALGGATMGLGAALFGLAPAVAAAVAGRLLVGLGASVMLIAWLSLIAAWFRPDEFATYSGLTQSIGNLGALVASWPLAVLVEAAGWRETFVLIGAVTLALAVVTVLTVRDRPDRAPARRRAPGLREVLAAVPAVVANPRTWPPALAAGGLYAALMTVQGLWGVPFLTQVYGLTRVEASSHVALIAVGSIVGAPLVGRLSDAWLVRRRLPLVVLAAGHALCWLPFVLPGDLRRPAALLPVMFFALGLTAAGLVLVWSCVREVNDPARVGVAVSFCNIPVFLGFALAQWISGLVLDARWTGLVVEGARVYPADAYRAVFALCLVIAVAAVGAALLVTETRCRNVWTPAR
jgi:sugar phosphate permease